MGLVNLTTKSTEILLILCFYKMDFNIKLMFIYIIIYIKHRSSVQFYWDFSVCSFFSNVMLQLGTWYHFFFSCNEKIILLSINNLLYRYIVTPSPINKHIFMNIYLWFKNHSKIIIDMHKIWQCMINKYMGINISFYLFFQPFSSLWLTSNCTCVCEAKYTMW